MIDDCSLLFPVFTVIANAAEIAQYNYLTVDVLQRAFFIRDITVLDGERVRISAAVDVLSSFADDILNATIISARASNGINIRVPDNKLSTGVQGTQQIKYFSGGELSPTVAPLTHNIVVSSIAANIWTQGG